MTTKVSMGLAALTLGAAVLTGCGSDSDGGGDFADGSGEDIVKSAKSDMGKLKSVQVTGSLTTDDQKVDLDLQMSTDADCTGTIGFGGGSTELLGTGGSIWMKPDEAFWKTFAGDSADQLMAVVGDKWVVMPDDEDGFAELCDLDKMLEELVDSEDDGSTYSKTGEEEVDGDQVVTIEIKEDDEKGVSTGYVLTDSPHYLVKVEKTDGDEPGSVTFGQFDEDVEVEAPADDEVIDLDSLG